MAYRSDSTRRTAVPPLILAPLPASAALAGPEEAPWGWGTTVAAAAPPQRIGDATTGEGERTAAAVAALAALPCDAEGYSVWQQRAARRALGATLGSYITELSSPQER